MEYNQNNQNQLTKPNKISPQEKERLLMQYAGIFRHNIKEYAEKYIGGTHSKKKNFSR